MDCIKIISQTILDLHPAKDGYVDNANLCAKLHKLGFTAQKYGVQKFSDIYKENSDVFEWDQKSNRVRLRNHESTETAPQPLSIDMKWGASLPQLKNILPASTLVGWSDDGLKKYINVQNGASIHEGVHKTYGNLIMTNTGLSSSSEKHVPIYCILSYDSETNRGKFERWVTPEDPNYFADVQIFFPREPHRPTFCPANDRSFDLLRFDHHRVNYTHLLERVGRLPKSFLSIIIPNCEYLSEEEVSQKIHDWVLENPASLKTLEKRLQKCIHEALQNVEADPSRVVLIYNCKRKETSFAIPLSINGESPETAIIVGKDYYGHTILTKEQVKCMARNIGPIATPWLLAA